jgi:raw score 15.66
MFEPPILNQLMGVGALLIGFAETCRHIKLQEERKEKERREEREFASMIIQGYNHAYERGREDKWQEIRKNIRRPSKGFTYDNERPEGLRPEPLALPEPKMHILK